MPLKTKHFSKKIFTGTKMRGYNGSGFRRIASGLWKIFLRSCPGLAKVLKLIESMRTIVLDQPIMPTVDAGPDQEVPDYSSSLIILSAQEIITSQGDFIDPNFTLVNQTIFDDATFENIGLSVIMTNVDVVNPHNFAFEGTIGLSFQAVGSWNIQFEANSPATFNTTSVVHSSSDNSYTLISEIHGDDIISRSEVTAVSGGPATNSDTSGTIFTITDQTMFFEMGIFMGIDNFSPGAEDSGFASIRIICTKL